MKNQKYISFLLIILVVCSISHAVEVRSIYLENGLEVVLMPDPSSPLISSLVIVHVGSGNESLATAGATHMLEHMMFRGTKTRSQGDIYDSMDLMGAYYNAQTQKNYTNYILVVPKEHAQEAMEIQVDMVLNSVIDPDTFEVEKGRVVAELEQTYSRASYVAENAHIKHLYGDSPYSFSTLGSINGIKNISRDEVAKFHSDWYKVNNITLVLRGDATFREMENLAKEVYGREVASVLPERPSSWPSGFDNWRQGQVHITYGDVNSSTLTVSLPAPRFDDSDYPAFTLLESFLNDILDEGLRPAGMPIITYVYTSITTNREFSVLNVHTGLMPGADPEIVAGKIIETVTTLPSLELSDEKVISKHESILREELFFSEQVQYGSFLLVPKLALAPYGFWEKMVDTRSGLTADDLVQVSNKWFDEPYYLASAYLPYPEEEETAESEVTFGTIESHTLDNGLVVHAAQIENVPVAGIHVVVKNRSLIEGESRRGWADLIHRLLLSGYEDVDKQLFEEELENIGMDISTIDNPQIPMDDYRTTPEYGFIRIQVLAERWPAALKLLERLLETPGVSAEEVEIAKVEQSSVIERNLGKLNKSARSLFKQKLYGQSVLAQSVYGDGIYHDQATEESIAEFAKEYLSSDNIVISVFSPAEPGEVINVITQNLSRIKKSGNNYGENNAPVSQPGEYSVTGKGMQGYLASGFLITDIDADDLPALKIANAMISDMIYRDLGEKRGWAYGAGSSLMYRPTSPGSENGWGSWSVSMGLPEEHLDESREFVYDHLATIAQGKFDNHRMEVAKQSILGAVSRRYSSRINLAMAAGHDSFIYGDPGYTWKYYDALKNVTIDEVRSIARKYLAKPANIVNVQGLPEKMDPGERKMPPMGMPGGMGR